MLRSAPLIVIYEMIIYALREMDSCSASFLERSREKNLPNDMADHWFISKKNLKKWLNFVCFLSRRSCEIIYINGVMLSPIFRNVLVKTFPTG